MLMKEILPLFATPSDSNFPDGSPQWQIYGHDPLDASDRILIASQLTQEAAQLFAAAPSLLEACELALDHMQQRIESMGDEEDCEFIQGAIDEANGVEQ